MNKILKKYNVIIETFNFAYSDLEKLLQKDIYISDDDKDKILHILRTLVVNYWKLLKYFLKEKNIIEYLPRQIINKAIQNDIIMNTQSCWFEYFDILEDYIYAENEKQRIELRDKILSSYIHQIKIVNNYINSFTNYLDLSEDDMKNLPKTKPLYSNIEIHIPENLYTILMNFFIENECIKYVWLHGSRAKNNYKTNSDIDLIADYPVEKDEEIKNLIDILRIPYFVDITSIHDLNNQNFIKRISHNAKIIYRKEDF